MRARGRGHHRARGVMRPGSTTRLMSPVSPRVPPQVAELRARLVISRLMATGTLEEIAAMTADVIERVVVALVARSI
jgi:hypothetical protein